VRFTWDPRKAAANVRKHHVTFEEAVTVFTDPLALITSDVVHVERSLIIGESFRQRVLLPCSSRLATRRSESSARGAQPAANGESMKEDKKREKVRRQREPSKASLREIPEVNLSNARVRRNPYAARIAREGMVVQVGRGRPRKILEVGGTEPRSVRFPDAVWKQIEERAKKRGLTVHAALREAVLAWLETAA
jgi:uncharacterized DUF497 family protein